VGSVRAVRLLISKVDLLESIFQHRYVDKGDFTDACAYLQAQYAALNGELLTICNNFGIRDYAFLCGNLISGEGVLPDWSRLLKRLYDAKAGEGQDQQ
jgi:hypothetical protein